MSAVAPRPMGLGRTLLLLGILEAFGPLSMDLYMPTLPGLATTLGTSDTMAQATMSVCMIGLGLGQLFVGPLSDRWGRRRPLLAGVALFALFSLLCALAPTIQLLLAARLLQGLAGSAGMVVAMAVARDLYHGAELSRMLSLLAVITSLTPIIAPVIGGQLAVVMDWRGIFGVLAGIGVAILIAAATGLRETLPVELRHRGGGRTSATHLGEVLRDRLFLALLLASSAGGVAFFVYLSMSSFVLQDGFGLTPVLFSLVFASNALSNLFGAQVSRLVVRRLGPAGVYLLGQAATLLATAGLLVVVIAGAPLPAVLACLLLYLFAVGLGGPNSTTLALDAHAARAGTASAVMGTAMFVVGPVVAPLAALGGATAFGMAAAMAVSSLVAAAVAFLAVRPLVRRGETAAAGTAQDAARS